MNYNYISQAICDCEQALNYQENNREKWQEACRNLGNILQGIGRFDEAIQWHSLALETSPNLAEVYFYLGQLHARQENWTEAIASLNNILKYQSNSAIAYSSLAQIHGHLGHQQAETDYWYDAVMVNPDMANGRAYLKLAQALRDRGKIEAAITCYQRAIERTSGFFAPYYELAEVWQQKGQLAQAIYSYQQILSQDPQQARAYVQIGKLYLKLHQYEDAIIAFRQAIQINPDFPWAYRELVKTFIQLKQWDEAIATCHAIINLVKEYPWVYSYLGNALRHKGNQDAALVAWQKACALRGWQECISHNYDFSQDNFSYRIPLCEPYLEYLVGQPDLKVLEIGSFQGMSTCWLLDRILTHSSTKLTCLEKNSYHKFAANIAKTGTQEKVTLLTGNILQLLTSLKGNIYDLIHFQQRAKSINLLTKNIVLAWQMLKVNGLMIIHSDNSLNYQFLDLIKQEGKIVDQASQANQIILQKIINC
jgi:tetratricopeptide (TPR) repeat protein